MAMPLEPIIKVVQQEGGSNTSHYVSLQNGLATDEDTGKNNHAHNMTIRYILIVYPNYLWTL